MKQIEIYEWLGHSSCDGKPTYRAEVKDKPQYWGHGPSIKTALGDLILTHEKYFNLETTCVGGKYH